MHSKQVLVWRGDVRNTTGQKVRTGKIAAQIAHASLAAILSIKRVTYDAFNKRSAVVIPTAEGDAVDSWINGTFTKVCVVADTEEAVKQIYNRARELNIPCSIITDNGLTEFGGVPTVTCCAVGPWESTVIDTITGELKLL